MLCTMYICIYIVYEHIEKVTYLQKQQLLHITNAAYMYTADVTYYKRYMYRADVTLYKC